MANNNTFEEAGIKLPTHVTAKEYFTVKKSDGSTVTKLPQELTDAEMRAASLGRSTVSPQFSYDNGKVKLSGGDKYINSDIVKSAAKTLQDYFKGKDLSNAQIAENFQKAIEGVNSMIEQNIQYQEYNDFLKSAGFSDEAYRNYALATQDASPTNSVNLLKSKNKYKGKKKDGSWDTLTATEWINYWKEAYNPEERAQLWMDASEALARANKKGATDDDLYAALPYILMGHKDSQNIPAQILNMLNPFDEGGLDWEKDIKNAKVNIPVYGFDDTNSLSVFIQSALRQLEKRGLSAAAGVLAFDNPWLELGSTTGGQYFGIEDWDDNDLEEMSREDYQDYVKLAKDAIAQGFDTYDKMKDEYGEELAKKMWVVNSFAKVDPRAVGGGRVLDTIRNEKGEVVAEEGDYPGYKTYQDFQSRVAEWKKGRGGFETWTEEATQDIDKYVQQMSVYGPNSATLGVVSGQIASFVAEQAALGLISGGALTASNIANTLARGGWKLAGNALGKIALGQKLIAKAPSVANTLAALAQGGERGWGVAKNLNAVAKAIYVVGEIGTWAIKEVGEDAIRGIIDDAVMRNSLDSQGNLDWNKFNENVYMNAVMAAIAHGGKGVLKGLASVVDNAATRNIDGVELNLSQRHQLNLLQKALDDQNNRIQFRGWDENNHPVITSYGKTKVLDQLTPPKEVMKAVDEAASVVTPTAARAIEEVLEDEDVSDTVKQKLVEISEEKITDGDDIKTRIEEVLTDDEIREAFPDGTMKVGDDIIRIDTKEFTSGDVGRVSGREYKTMEEAIDGLKTAVKARDFSGSINAIMRFSVEAAKEFKQAVDGFADAHNMSERDVMKAIRGSRIAGQETIPGLQQLWDQSWNPLASKLLDLQEQLTGIRPTEHNFYFRDMVEGTFNPGVNGSYSINQGSVVDMLGGDSEFDLAASSTARNTGKLGEIAADKLEYDPEILMREYVASRMQTIWQSDDMGKVFATLQEAHDAGEFDLTEEQARVSIGATERVASDVENSEGVQTIQDMTNVYELDETFGEEDIKQLNDDIKTQKEQIARTQAEIDNIKPKAKPMEIIPEMDYATRKALAKDFVKKNPEYILVYRNQNTGVDDWYSNGTGHGAHDPSKFESYGSDKGDLTDAVWLTTDEKWAESPELATAGGYNGVPDNTVVFPIKKSLIVDAGSEHPSYDPKLGKADMGSDWGPYYSLRKFSELNDNKVVQTRATQLEDVWIKARDEAGTVTDNMRDRLNKKFYDHTELVLFRDSQPDVMRDGYQKMLDIYNEREAILNKRAIRRLEGNLADEKRILSDLEARKANAEKAMAKPVDQSKPVSTSEENEVIQQSELKRLYGENKKTILDAQKKFNNSAKKSNAAELVSRNSGYSNRSIRADARAPIGVNYMPGDPFGPLGKWVNDNFIKGNSIVTQYSGYKADGTPTLMTISAYDGGYKMYAEAGSFARNVIIDVQNGDSLYDAIYKQVYNNGFFIEPSPSQIKRYGALKVKDQAANITDKIMDRIVKDQRFNYVFDADGTVKSTDGLLAILTTRFKGQGISDFTKFTRKVDWDSLTKGQKDWMNARMYEMTASVNRSTAHKVVDGLMRAAMALRYKSNMYWNFKNGQLQLTECQRLYTMNKIGDFASTVKRLTTDGDFRQKASDMTYILAADSAGAGLSKTELEKATDAYTKLGAGSAISKDGILTDIDAVKAKFGDFDDAALASIHGGEYAKNYFLIAGFIAAGERQGLEGAELDAYVRNRFNVEALAGTKVGKIGLNDSRIGQFTFMYLGFPIRDLTLQIHAIKAGGTLGGDTKFKKFIGAADYMAKMLGAKGLMWAVEAPWGYSLMDQLNIDPFGVLGQYEQINTPYEDREPGWRVVDYLVRYNPLLQGAVTNTIADIYMSYRAAEEEARAEYMEEHDGSDEGFQWSIFQDGAENLDDIMRGLAPVGEAALGYIPGYTAYSRVAGEVNDLDRGYHLSESGNRLYETNTDLGNVMWGALTGRKNTANAQSYYQTPSPIRGLIDNGLAGLGQQFGRAINPFRGFREFDPVDTDTYEDWFDGSYQDQQNWNSGIYQFRDEAQQIKEKYDKYIAEGREVNSINARENELADLRARLEKYVEAYTAKHPDGINLTKQNQLIGILNMGGQRTLDEAFSQSQGEYSDEWDKAQARYSQGDFPTAYGMKQNSKGEISYGQSPQLEQVLSQQRYGISSDVAPVIEQMYKNTTMSTPAGDMTMKDYHDKIYSQLQAEWNKSKTDYDKVTKLQEGYLATISKNVIQPILNTYGSSVLSAGRSSDIMQEFGKMLYGMVPSDEYRLDKKGKKIYKSTPYMTIDIPAWLRKNFTKYQASVNSTNRETSQRLLAIRDSLDNGRTSTAKAKARALVQDIGNGKASVSRNELEWLQGVLND